MRQTQLSGFRVFGIVVLFVCLVAGPAVHKAAGFEHDFLTKLRSGRLFEKSPEPQGSHSSVGSLEDYDSRPKRLPVQPDRGATRSPTATYRTVCVRLCDGAFFPISASTYPNRFRADANMCARRCNSPASLFVYPTSSGSPETMVDLDGNAYSRLPKANLFRTTYNPSCKCKPHPWETEALERYELQVSAGSKPRVAKAEQKREKPVSSGQVKTAENNVQGEPRMGQRSDWEGRSSLGRISKRKRSHRSRRIYRQPNWRTRIFVPQN